MDSSRRLIVFGDRNLEWSRPLRKKLRERGVRVAAAASAHRLMELVEKFQPDLVVLGDLEDADRLLGSRLRERSPRTGIIRVLSSQAGCEETAEGALGLTSGMEDLPGVIEKALLQAPKEPSQSQPPLVVCVDDDALYLESLARIIRRQGYRVMIYQDPKLALEELPLVKPDLLILDVLMPGLSGFEVLDEVRRSADARPPVVLLSAVDSEEKIAEGREHGAACYLTKPCAPERLIEVMHGLVRRPDKPPGMTTRRYKRGKVP